MRRSFLAMLLILSMATPAFAGPFSRLFRRNNCYNGSCYTYYYNYNEKTAWDFPETVEATVRVETKPENCDEACWKMLVQINQVRTEKGLAKLVW